MLLTFFDDAPVVPCPVSTPTAEYQTVTFVADDGATLSARYIRPVGNKRVPTVLMFHDAGRPVRGWHHMTRFVALGYAVFTLENRAEADAQTQFADAQAAARAALSLPTTLNLIAWGEGLAARSRLPPPPNSLSMLSNARRRTRSARAHMPIVRNMPRSSSARC